MSLAQVTSFKYLGRVLEAEDNNWLEVVRNLRRVRHKWERLTQILSRKGADAHDLGRIYITVVQLIMLYGFETWVLTQQMKGFWGRFYHRVTRRLTVGKRGGDGTEYRFTPQWRIQQQRQDFNVWILTSPANA